MKISRMYLISLSLSLSLSISPSLPPPLSLPLPRAEPSDAGQLRCVAASPEGRDSAAVTVVVLTPPSFVDPSAPTQLTVRAGAPVELDCRVDGYPTPKVRTLVIYQTDTRHPKMKMEDNAGVVPQRTLFDFRD